MKWFLNINSRKTIKFTANLSKNAQHFCKNQKKIQYVKTSLHTHDKDHVHYPQDLKLASGTHTEWILSRDSKKFRR